MVVFRQNLEEESIIYLRLSLNLGKKTLPTSLVRYLTHVETHTCYMARLWYRGSKLRGRTAEHNNSVPGSDLKIHLQMLSFPRVCFPH